MKKKINPIKFEKKAPVKKTASKKRRASLQKASAKKSVKQKKFVPLIGILKGSIFYDEDLTEPLDLSWNADTDKL